MKNNLSRESKITEIEVSNGSIIKIPYLDRRDMKKFIDNIVSIYNIESLDEYKNDKNKTNLKAAIEIVKINNTNQDIIDSIFKI